MGDAIGRNIFTNNHILSQQDCDSNTGDVSSGNGFMTSHTLSQCNGVSTFTDMDGEFENDDVISGYGYINSHTVYQYNGLK